MVGRDGKAIHSLAGWEIFLAMIQKCKQNIDENRVVLENIERNKPVSQF